MFWLAHKILFYKKARLAVTLLGIALSTLLTLTQIGIYLGMMGDATAIIRNCGADIWVASKNIQNFDFANPYPEVRIHRAKQYSDVLWAKNIILTWGFLKLETGAREQVQIVGFDPESTVCAPWSLLQGETGAVKGGAYIILDASAKNRIGPLTAGQYWELNGRRTKLVAISQGIKTFTTAPLVFSSYNFARSLISDRNGEPQTVFTLVKIADGAQVSRVVEALRQALPNNDVYSHHDFVFKTVLYWTFQTGMGMAIFLTATLGVLIGGSIVGQTIYASTMENIQEYGTLKAMGAENIDITVVILAQATIGVVIGFSLGTLALFGVADLIENAGVTLYLGSEIVTTLLVSFLITCFFSAYLSVRRVRILDPMIVFRN
jgi:putative ABC transport system permease protein